LSCHSHETPASSSLNAVFVVAGARIEGKYKNNILVASVSGGKSSSLFALRSGKLRDRVDAAVRAAARAADVARQKAEIANARFEHLTTYGIYCLLMLEQ
jgi:hypothetical protein